jgi:DNA (cytosine-5)-methyltransferase 1
MMPPVTYISVCSGIEAATMAWHPLGFRPLAFSEIEPFPRAVLAHHYPDVPLHGDFTVLRDQDWIAGADILVGGTPCQAFSIAGLRRSLDDDRGNLSLEFVRLADAIDALRLPAGREPAIIVWENVPGVLSVKDNAFGCFLAALAGDATPYVPPRGKWTNAGVVDGPARAVAWRTLDAQYFGLAQRRRRVFVVASARTGFDPAAVLLEFEGLRRDTPPRREKGKIAPTIHSRSTAGGGLGTDFDCDGGVIRAFGGNNTEGPIDVATARNACATASGRMDFESETFLVQPVTHALRAEGFDASEDGTGRGTLLVPVAVPLQEVGKRTGVSTDDPRAGIGIGQDGDPMFTLQAGAQHGVAVSVSERLANRPRPTREQFLDGLAPHLDEYTPVAIPFDTTQITSPSNYSRPKEGDPRHPLAAAAHPPAVAYPLDLRNAGRDPEKHDAVNRQGVGVGEDGDPMHTLSTAFVPGVAVSVALRGREGGGTAELGDEIGNTLRASTGGGDKPHVLTSMAVRRLTPVECERLQGFPDGHTAIPWRGKPAADCPDGPRYKALDNSMAVPVMAWIGRRIAAALEAGA